MADGLRTNEQQLRAFWRALVRPGEVREVRIPKARKGPRGWWAGSTYSGWFDDEDAFIQSVAAITGRDAPGAYVTLNPVKPDLKARRANRLDRSAEGENSRDVQITKRTTLLIDADPVREAGISSTDAELAAALAVRDEIAKFLADNGFPEPLALGMSGNGGHLLLRVDLPNDDTSTRLVANFLAGLQALFGSDTVKIDQSVSNASRISKVFGSVVAKGDHLPERPWRIARAEFNPNAAPVPRALLESVAALAPHPELEPEQPNASGMGPERSWSVADILTWNRIGYRIKQQGTATVYLLDRCLSSADHTDGAAITEQGTGRLGYKCHHERCLGQGWHQVKASLRIDEWRAAHEPRIHVNGSAGHRSTGASGFQGGQTSPSGDSTFSRIYTGDDSENENGAGPAEFPVDVLPDVARQFVEEAAASLECPVGMVGTPFLSHVAGVLGNRHAVTLKPGYRTNAILWTLVVAESGTAKSPATAQSRGLLDGLQKDAKQIYDEERAAYEEELAAWQAVPKKEQAGRGPKPKLPQLEHFYTTDATVEAVGRMLGHEDSKTPGFVVLRDELSGWVKSFDQYKGGKGGEREIWLSLWSGMAFKSDRAGREPYYVTNPAISVCGGTQPGKLSDLSSEAELADGFIPRFLFEMPDTKPMGWTDRYVSPETRNRMVDLLGTLRCQSREVHLSEGARRNYITWVNENARLQDGLTGLIAAYYAKLPLQLARLALILHALADPAPEKRNNVETFDQVPRTTVSADTMAAAITLVEYYRETAHRVLPRFGAVGTGKTGGVRVRIYRILTQAAPGWVPSTEIYRRLGSHVPADERRSVLSQLVEEGLAEYRKEILPAGGRPVESWRGTQSSTSENMADAVARGPQDEEQARAGRRRVVL